MNYGSCASCARRFVPSERIIVELAGVQETLCQGCLGRLGYGRPAVYGRAEPVLPDKLHLPEPPAGPSSITHNVFSTPLPPPPPAPPPPKTPRLPEPVEGADPLGFGVTVET